MSLNLKKVIIFFLVATSCSFFNASAQAPEKMSYQAVIRGANSNLIKNHPIGMRVSILQGSSTGTEVYKEIYNPNPQTNANGLVSLEIGTGIPLTSTFSAINWKNGTYYIKIETDTLGGTNYTVINTSQLLTVPYAMHAKSAETLSGGPTVATTGSYNDLTNKPSAGNGIQIDGSNIISLNLASQAAGDMMYFDGTNWLRVPKGTTGQFLTLNSSGVPEWGNAQIPPSATTNASSKLYASTITLNGIADGFGTSTIVSFEYGVTNSYGNIMIAQQSPITSNTAVTASFSGLVPGTTYHYRVKATNAFGTTYGDDLTFIHSDFYYGQPYAGGLIFYIDNTGLHGLVCADADATESSIEWGCNGSLISGADGANIGTGNQNTIDITNGCTTIGIAAELCSSLSLNLYTDWFLPSINELNAMYTNLKLAGKGNFAELSYWSSTEASASEAYYSHFSNGLIFKLGKNVTFPKVRAIRAF
ncbi:MAG: hypothetical protein WCK02_00340 [Bacteroidota bacterium]